MGGCAKKFALGLFLSIGISVHTLADNSSAGGSSSSVANLQQIADALKNNPQLAKQLQQVAYSPSSANQSLQATTATATQQGSQSDQNEQPQQSQDLSEAQKKAAADQEQKSQQQMFQQSINEEAFRQLKQEAFPLSPTQIQTMRNMLDETQRAQAADPFNQSPAPVSSSLFVRLSPGATPPVIRLSQGFVSSLVFIDSTGATWPIQAYDLGNPSAFNISWNRKGNTLFIQARTSYTYGNLAVKLEALDTPVMLTLVPGQKAVDYRVDLRVEGLGPNAKPTLHGSGMPDAASPLLLSILDGVAPEGSEKLTVTGAAAEAWLYDKKLYFRSRYKVLSPAWISKMSSADGMNAYELPKTPTVLVSRHGKAVQLKIEGF